MANKLERGTKRKCQNEDCAIPFYDLNVAEPDCPTCGTAFDHDVAKQATVTSGSVYRRGRQAPVFEIVAPEPIDDVTETVEDAEEIDSDSSDSDQILDIDEDD
ncbi:MAG: FYDLN acid domain-containing protein [Alphaproteobacteria bacterium]|nr:FYDLN acid domain-containing protein [Alphaproteobacteria bacterium]